MMGSGMAGITAAGGVTGRHALLLSLARMGIFRRRILRYLYRLAVSPLCRNGFPDIPVYVVFNGGATVQVTSCDGDFVDTPGA